MTIMPKLPQRLDGSSYSEMRRERAALGEAKFVEKLVASANGYEMYLALMRISNLTEQGRDALLRGLVDSGHVIAIGLAYAHFEKMPKHLRNALIDKVIELGDAHGAYVLLADHMRLPPLRRNALVDVVSSDVHYRACTIKHGNRENLTLELLSKLENAGEVLAA